MNKTNIQAFEDRVIEVRFILTDEAIELLKKFGYNDLLAEYNYALENDRVSSTFCQLMVAFFIDDEICKTEFALFTHVYYYGEDFGEEASTFGITFDQETAEYFKAQALKMLEKNFNDMQKCKHLKQLETA